MDVTVTHLNNRLALQIPAELPLGLVFVVGRVSGLGRGDNGRSTPPTQFTLTEQAYGVRCVLSARAAAETTLQEGDTIRAGGHLAFDPRRADYFLRVRDVEVIPASPELAASSPPPEREALAAVLADVKKRAIAANMATDEMPTWVRRLAPPEVRPQMIEEEETAVSFPSSSPDEIPLPFDEAALKQLSAAMDSDEEVELTPDLLADLLPDQSSPVTPPTQAEDRPEETAAQSAVDDEDPDAYSPQTTHDDRLVRLLLFVFFLIAILIVVAIITML